ncbi:MAG: cell division protein FtsW [Planctomycetes bacterium]|nr:cell division protein FtsW [Planctomycetota bacterium]
MTANPLLDYFMICLLVCLLTGLGLVMVFSSSMTWSARENSSVWAEATRHAVMVVIGLFFFWVALKFPLGWIRRLAPALTVLTTVLLVLVLTPLGTGRAEVGSQSWLPLGPIQLQPSEMAKVAIAVFGAWVLSRSREKDDPRRLKSAWLFGGVAGAWFILIALQGDYGMALSFGLVMVFALFFAGVNMRVFLGILVVGVVGIIAVIAAGGYRSQRFLTYFDTLLGNFDDTRGAAYQSHQGFLSLADGSVFGVGLGQSRAKWFYLPEAKNDFIFAIIGEELGLWGGALVILGFAALGVFGLRAATRAQNRFQALLAATLTAGVVSQAFINIGYVVGLLPVTGIQLPMISAGGTSTVITLASMGVLAAVARHEPEAISYMQNYGRPVTDRMLFIQEPGMENDETRSLSRTARRDEADEAADGGARRTRGGREAATAGRYGRPVTAGRDARPDSADGGGTRVGKRSQSVSGRAGSVEAEKHPRRGRPSSRRGREDRPVQPRRR